MTKRDAVKIKLSHINNNETRSFKVTSTYPVILINTFMSHFRYFSDLIGSDVLGKKIYIIRLAAGSN